MSAIEVTLNMVSKHQNTAGLTKKSETQKIKINKKGHMDGSVS